MGKLIVIDGIDGSGKATQTKILVEKIRQQGLAVEILNFPQYENNFFGGLVRQYLDGKFGKPTTVSPYLASVLYAADRWESAPKINQWLQKGKIVILDRYYTSNLIHQSAKLDETQIDDFISWIKNLEFDTFKIPQPDLVIYLHVPAEISHELVAERGSGHDGHENTTHLKIAEQRCLYLAEELGWEKIECYQNNQLLSIEQIAEKVWQIVKKNI
ncbi:MAG: dTMP kinase [Candidatus Buchananbacteria bacterium RIFCSPHIGHO2_02_FULL_38_8]|uniref:Thymidylate kinase n=1 Tax=Candidatus Buchananbacteria bacterium RIFCSPHIGHO2_02_FULL_38_8 TaxID=1797538 RepID=A0A1G1Y6L5_9BACT|nr:MAG: dTMP kinase [Candidatus Buchananbacteria bacterium RIFCSPHIGHO2_02_FULL_38_8]